MSCLAATTRRTRTLPFETSLAALLEPTSTIHSAKRSPNSTSFKTRALGRFTTHESVESSRDFETNSSPHASDGAPNFAIVFRNRALRLSRDLAVGVQTKTRKQRNVSSRNCGSMWRMKKVVDRGWVTLHMSGHLEAEHLAEIQNALADEGMNENVVLDLSEVTVIAEEAVRFLAHFEVNRIDLHKCPAYIRDWIAEERRATRRYEQSDSGD